MHRSFRIIPVLAAAITLLPVGSAAQVQQVAARSLSPTTTDAAAAAEFNAALDDWYTWSWTSANQHMGKARQMDPSMALARVASVFFAGGVERPLARNEMTSAVAEAARGSAAEAAYGLGLRELALRGAASAQPLFAAAATLTPGDLRIGLASAITLTGEARIAALRGLVKQFPEAPAARLWLAYYLTEIAARVDARNAEEAMSHAREAVRLAPEHTGTHTVLAHVLERMLRHEEATAELRLATAMSPGNAYAYYLMAEIAVRDGRPAEARPALDQAVRLTPDATMATNYKTWSALTYLHEGNVAKALSELETLADQQESEGLRMAAATHMWCATIVSLRGDAEAIAQHYAEAKRLGATPAALGNGAALDYGRIGHAAEARKGLEAYTTAIAATPGAAGAATIHNLTGYVLIAENRPADAINEFLLINRRGPYAQLGLALAYEKAGQKQQAAAERQALLARKDFSFGAGESGAIAIARLLYGGK